MSVINYIRCKTCKRYLWVGQRNHIYTGRDYIEILRRFLFIHKSGYSKHSLDFVNEFDFNRNGFEGWIDFEEEDAQNLEAWRLIIKGDIEKPAVEENKSYYAEGIWAD